jgi:hypothetical protein
MTEYMGLFVEEEVEVKGCSTCKFEKEVDRAECNACARRWNESGYLSYCGWEPKEQK